MAHSAVLARLALLGRLLGAGVCSAFCAFLHDGEATINHASSLHSFENQPISSVLTQIIWCATGLTASKAASASGKKADSSWK